MDGRARIEAADVTEIVAHASTIAMDAATLEAFSGDMRAAEMELDAALTKGADATQLISGALRYALSLHRGRSAGGVMAVKRGGFFSVPDRIIDAHLKRWSLDRLLETIERLRAAQTRARAHAELAEVEAARVFMNVARTAVEGVNLAATAKFTSREGRNPTLYSHPGTISARAESTRTEKIDFAQRPHRGIRR